METAEQNICLAEKEHGHISPYLTWVHQSDGFCYFKCEFCGWIKPDKLHPTTANVRFGARLLTQIAKATSYIRKRCTQ